MDAYKQYVDYIMAGGVAETAYVLSRQGALCATNLPIKQMPKYQFALEDEKDPNVKHNIVVDELAGILGAIADKDGVTKEKAGLRIYNQKYYLARHTADDQTGTKIIYLKKEHGGACICTTYKFILIGTFNTQLKMQNGVPQNPGELNKRVEELAKTFMKSAN